MCWNCTQASKEICSTVELSHGGRPRKLTRAMEQSCVLDMTRGKLNIVVEATKNVQEAFGMQVCVETMRCALCRGGLQSQVKQKKTTSLNQECQRLFRLCKSPFRLDYRQLEWCHFLPRV